MQKCVRASLIIKEGFYIANAPEIVSEAFLEVRSGNFWGRGPESYTISIDYVNSRIQRYFLRISLKVVESIISPVGLGA